MGVHVFSAAPVWPVQRSCSAQVPPVRWRRRTPARTTPANSISTSSRYRGRRRIATTRLIATLRDRLHSC